MEVPAVPPGWWHEAPPPGPRRLPHARYHLVFPTKYGRKVLQGGMGACLSVLMRAIRRRHPEIEVLEVNTDEDHVHLLIGLAPKMAVSEAVRILRANTARQMRAKFPYIEKAYWGDPGVWSDGYFVSTVGVDEEVIRKYIQMQGKEDGGQAELELC